MYPGHSSTLNLVALSQSAAQHLSSLFRQAPTHPPRAVYHKLMKWYTCFRFALKWMDIEFHIILSMKWSSMPEAPQVGPSCKLNHYNDICKASVPHGMPRARISTLHNLSLTHDNKEPNVQPLGDKTEARPYTYALALLYISLPSRAPVYGAPARAAVHSLRPRCLN